MICFRPTCWRTLSFVQCQCNGHPQRSVVSRVSRSRHCFVTELTRMAPHSHPAHPCCSKLRATQNGLVLSPSRSQLEQTTVKLHRLQRLLRRALTWLHSCTDLCTGCRWVPCLPTYGDLRAPCKARIQCRPGCAGSSSTCQGPVRSGIVVADKNFVRYSEAVRSETEVPFAARHIMFRRINTPCLSVGREVETLCQIFRTKSASTEEVFPSSLNLSFDVKLACSTRRRLSASRQ